MRPAKAISCILSIIGVCALAPRIPAQTLASPHPTVIAANMVIDGDGEHATVLAYQFVYTTTGDPPTTTVRRSVRTFDTLVREADGCWRIARRTGTFDGA